MLLPLIAIGALATTNAADAAAAPTAVVARNADEWTLTYRLPVAKAWMFPVSAVTLAEHAEWRERDWRVLTPGVALVRRGNYDVLEAPGGAPIPSEVRIVFKPTPATLDREYDPAVAFSNGAVALYSEQFGLVSQPDAGAISEKPAGLSRADLGGSPTEVQFKDSAGPVFVQGRRQRDPILKGAETYVIFGPASVEESPGVAMLADPALPSWLKVEMSTFAPKVAEAYEQALGPRIETGRPLLLMAWRGPIPGKVVADGAVRPGEILLNFAGEGLLDRNPAAARRARWFIAHEMAHFWLGTSGVAYRTPSDAWITEGGADVMAFTLLAQDDPEYAAAELQRAVEDCGRLARKPVATAADRHESRSLYACGAVFALAAVGAERAAGGRDYFDFLRPLLVQHRQDRRISTEEWLAELARISPDRQLVATIRTLVEQGSEMPEGQIRSLLAAAKVTVNSLNTRV